MRRIGLIIVGICLLGLAVASCVYGKQPTPPVSPPVKEEPVPPTPPVTAKVSCLIIGDSIAVGTGQQLGGCVTDRKVGIPSNQIISKVKPAIWLVISSGTNDATNPELQANLEKTRKQATDRVVWILSQLKGARDAELAVAKKYGDATVSFVAGPDHIHPHSYLALSRSVLEKLK